jgi:hypothetical protein
MKCAIRAIVNVALGALLAIPMCAAAQQSQSPAAKSQRTASGIDLLVLDPSGSAIPKARVIITDGRGNEIANSLTDRSGRFSVSQVPPGPYKLTVRLNGFQAYSKTHLVKEHIVTELNVTLPVDPIPDPVHHGELTLALVVKDETGAVIPNASVLVTQEETGAKFDRKTNQVGTYQASGLASGNYTVIVKALGFKTFKASTALAAQETIEITVTLKVSPTDVDPPMYALPAPAPEAKPSTPDYEFLPTH